MANKKWNKENSIEAIETFYKKNGRYPLSMELSGRILPKTTAFKREVGMTYAEWLAKKGIKRKTIMDNKYKSMTKRELIKWFKEISLTRGYTSIHNHDYRKSSTDPSINYIIRKIGDDGVEEIKEYIHCVYTLDNIKKIKDDFLKIYDGEYVPGFKSFNPSLRARIIENFLTYNNFLNYLGLETRNQKPREKTKQEMLNDYYDLYKKLGRTPRGSDFTKDMEVVTNYDICFG